jgi:hypothetical protein
MPKSGGMASVMLSCVTDSPSVHILNPLKNMKMSKKGFWLSESSGVYKPIAAMNDSYIDKCMRLLMSLQRWSIFFRMKGECSEMEFRWMNLRTTNKLLEFAEEKRKRWEENPKRYSFFQDRYEPVLGLNTRHLKRYYKLFEAAKICLAKSDETQKMIDEIMDGFGPDDVQSGAPMKKDGYAKEDPPLYLCIWMRLSTVVWFVWCRLTCSMWSF